MKPVNNQIVGNQGWSQINLQIENRIKDRVESQIRKQVAEQVWWQVEGQVWNSAISQVCLQIDLRIGNYTTHVQNQEELNGLIEK